MLKCSDYDHLELICLYKYPVELSLKPSSTTHDNTIQGTATDIAYNDDRKECIKIVDDETSHLVVIEDITRLKVTVENPHVRELIF